MIHLVFSKEGFAKLQESKLAGLIIDINNSLEISDKYILGKYRYNDNIITYQEFVKMILSHQIRSWF